MKTLLIDFTQALQLLHTRKYIFSQVKSMLKFSNLNCKVLEKNFGEFTTCKINAISRKTSTVSIHLKLWRTVTDCTMQFALLRRANGWRPFMYDMKFDVCDFFRQPRKYFLINLVRKIVSKNTNINHTCPYKSGEDIILQSFEFDETELLSKFPIDVGEYAVHANFLANGRNLVTAVNISLLYTDYKNN